VTSSPTLPSRVQVPGAALAYRIEGPVDAPVMVLAHGLGADLRMWEDCAAEFARNYRVLRFDLRGHGRSSTPPGRYSADALAQDAIALLDELRLGRVHFVGNCLGARLGLQLALRYGNRLESLVLCGVDSAIAGDGLPESARDIPLRDLDAVVQPSLERWVTAGFRRTHPEQVEALRSMIQQTRVAGWFGGAAVLSEGLQGPRGDRPSLPLLVISARERSDPHANTWPWMESFGGRWTTVRPAGQLVNFEQPGLFNTALREFLATCGGRVARSNLEVS